MSDDLKECPTAAPDGGYSDGFRDAIKKAADFVRYCGLQRPELLKVGNVRDHLPRHIEAITPDGPAATHDVTLSTAAPDEKLADEIKRHWNCEEGAAMAREYLAKRRDDLAMSHLTDFQLANAVYLVDGASFDLIAFQTAAKERIRWLSVQLAALRQWESAAHFDTGAEPLKFIYRNYRGEISVRRVIPKRIWHGQTEYHPKPQWLMTAFDVEKQADRDFAMLDIRITVPATALAFDSRLMTEQEARIEYELPARETMRAAVGIPPLMPGEKVD